jgi:hypothetical protein
MFIRRIRIRNAEINLKIISIFRRLNKINRKKVFKNNNRQYQFSNQQTRKSINLPKRLIPINKTTNQQISKNKKHRKHSNINY